MRWWFCPQHHQQCREEKVLSSSFSLQLFGHRLGLSQAPHVTSALHAQPSPAPPSFFDPSTPIAVKLDCCLVLQMSVNTVWTVTILEQRKTKVYPKLAGMLSTFSLIGQPASRAESVLGPCCTLGFLLTDFGFPRVGCRTTVVLRRIFLATAVCPK